MIFWRIYSQYGRSKRGLGYAIQDELKIRAVGKIGQRVGFGQIVHGNLLFNLVHSRQWKLLPGFLN